MKSKRIQSVYKFTGSINNITIKGSYFLSNQVSIFTGYLFIQVNMNKISKDLSTFLVTIPLTYLLSVY